MIDSCDPDRQFHENLRSLGGRVEVPAGPSAEVRARCLATFGAARSDWHRRFLKMLRKPTVASAVGLAACVLVAFTLLFPTNGNPVVQAAVIMQKLNEQIEQAPLLEVTLDSVTIGDSLVNGQLRVAQNEVAGDMDVRYQSPISEKTTDIDLALAVTRENAWILIRSLTVSDPQAERFVFLWFPPGMQTLVSLTPEQLNAAGLFGFLRAHELVPMFLKLIDTPEDYGAILTEQTDGTWLLTLPIEDAETLATLERNANAVKEDHELIGSTLEVVYDPDSDAVLSFSIYDLRPTSGCLTVDFADGLIDPALLDPDNLVTPQTRVLDFQAFEPLLESLMDVVK